MSNEHISHVDNAKSHQRHQVPGGINLAVMLQGLNRALGMVHDDFPKPLEILPGEVAALDYGVDVLYDRCVKLYACVVSVLNTTH